MFKRAESLGNVYKSKQVRLVEIEQIEVYVEETGGSDCKIVVLNKYKDYQTKDLEFARFKNSGDAVIDVAMVSLPRTPDNLVYSVYEILLTKELSLLGDSGDKYCVIVREKGIAKYLVLVQ